jgi:hypothetical protein
MGKMVRIPAGNTTNEHYNFVVAKPLVLFKIIIDSSTVNHEKIYYIFLIDENELVVHLPLKNLYKNKLIFERIFHVKKVMMNFKKEIFLFEISAY